MRGTPKKGRRFGGSAAHQKAMMGNLVASLDRRRVPGDHRGQGQGPAPGRREGDHRGRARAASPASATWSPSSGTRTWPTSSSRRSVPATRTAPVATPGSSSSGTRLGRQRPDGPHRTGVSPAPDSSGADGRTVRWRMTVAYDGSGFHGFAAQNGQHTVAGALAEALERIVGQPVTLTCAGRTDAGVHALDQVVHFDLDESVAARIDPASVTKSCNSQLAPAVVVRSARAGRRGVRRRAARRAPVATATWCSTRRCPIRCSGPHLARDRPPRPRAMLRAGADALLGEHDFRAFCRRARGNQPGTSPSTAGCSRRAGAAFRVWRRPPGSSGSRPGADRRPGARGRRPLFLRDRGDLVLPPDGPLDRGDPGRRRPWPQTPLRHPLDPALGRPPPRLPAGARVGAHPGRGALRRFGRLAPPVRGDLSWDAAGATSRDPPGPVSRPASPGRHHSSGAPGRAGPAPSN